MVPFILGHKRKATAAFDMAVKSASKAAQLAASGDYQAAILHYDQAMETLRHDLHRQSPVTRSMWVDGFCRAALGKARAAAALERDSVEQIEAMMSEGFSLKADWPEAHEFIIGLALSRRQAEKARPHLNRLLMTNPHDERSRFSLAVLDFDGRRYEEALGGFALLPESSNTLCYTARCYLRSGQLDRAIEILERAMLRFGETYECHYYLGCALGHAGRFDDARDVFGRLSRWTPRRPEAMIQLGNLYLISGWVAEAERCFKEAIKIAPHDPLPAYYGLALAASANDRDRFDACVEIIRHINPGSEFLRCVLGVAAERAGDLRQAIREYGSVPTSGAMAGAAATRRGFIHYRQGNFARAVEALGEAARLHPWDNKLLEMFGKAAAVTGDYRRAVKVWGRLPNPVRSEVSRCIRAARMEIIANCVERGRTREAIEQLEEGYRETGDPAFGRALADSHFAGAVAALRADPPDLQQARQFLLLGKTTNAHPKFEYGLAIADLVEGDNQSAATRLRAVLAANAKNPGASYHLGLALLRNGDHAAAENALRHGVTVSFNRPSRLGRLKYALAVLLAREQRWAESAAALEDFVPGEETGAQPTLAEALELRIRCLALGDDWEAAEQAILKATTGQRTATAALILACRNVKSGRFADASIYLEHYLRMAKTSPPENASLADRATRALAPIALRGAAEEARRREFNKALRTLKRASAALTDMGFRTEHSRTLNGFIEALDKNDQPTVERLAELCELLEFDFSLEKADLAIPQIDIPIVFPQTPPAIFDTTQRDQLDPSHWDASPYPDPLVIFDS